MEFYKGRSKAGPNVDSLADALAIAQHHDGISGTSKQHVANDYAKRVSIGYDEVVLICQKLFYLMLLVNLKHKIIPTKLLFLQAARMVEMSLACMLESSSKTGCRSPTTKFQQVNNSHLIHF